MLWGFRLPQLAIAEQVLGLAAALMENGVQVLLLDPLYLSLLANTGEHRLSAANLFDIGPLLMRIAQECLHVGCTPVFAHHARMHIEVRQTLGL